MGDGDRELIDPLLQSEWDLEDEVEAEAESIPRQTARNVLRINLLGHRFRATNQFLDDWMKWSSAGVIGTSMNFRKRFCDANHYEVAVQIKGRTRILRVVELWGLPMVYLSGDSPSPLLMKILPRGWHLSKVGRSVGPPRTCRPKP